MWLYFRKLQKTEERIVTFQNHLHFTLHCRHHGIFSPSMQLKCSMKGQVTRRILDRAQNALMNARIKQIKNDRWLPVAAAGRANAKFLEQPSHQKCLVKLRDTISVEYHLVAASTRTRSQTSIKFRQIGAKP